MPRINNVDMGLAKVAISNLNYINKFKKQAISKLIETVPLVKLKPEVSEAKMENKVNIKA